MLPFAKFKNRRSIQGFTLVELMIVVAIIGVLAGVAVPQYKVYVIRAKVSEAIVASGAVKVALAEYVQTKGTWPSDISDVGINIAAVGTYIQSYYNLVADPDYGFSIELKGTGESQVDTKHIYMLSNFAYGGGISKPMTWRCAVLDAVGTYEPVIGKYVPSVCHNNSYTVSPP
ncbi:MAG: pilin [Gammaproteobacteria bacterium]|nr:pilin [Gammaproteobacteria bacterium]MCP5136237.1 pilin [Gammaproteobacteria bacterium]